MNRENFDHVLRALADMTKDAQIYDGQIILFGSQAIIAHMDPTFFNDMDAVYFSREVDVTVDVPDEKQQSEIARFIYKNIGEASRFDQTHGIYIDGVELNTPVFPSDWRCRLVPVFIPGVPDDLYVALSVRDIVASKLYAGREKDYVYISDLIKSRHPDLVLVEKTLEELPENPKTQKAKAIWNERYLPQIGQLNSRQTKTPKA